MASRPKLLVRAWLPRRGCCHLRSPEMTDAEARSLLDAARGAIDKAQESGVIERVPCATGCAFVMARRSPDPNQPGRTALGFVLVSIPDPDTFLRDAVADRLRAVELPETSDVASEGWEFLDLGVPTIVPPNPDTRPKWRRGIASLYEKASPRNVANETRPRRWRSFASFLFRNWQIITPVLVLLAVCLFASLYFNPFKHLLRRDALPTRSPGKSDGSEDEKKRQWTRYRDEIKDLLQQDWARRILDSSPERGSRVPKTAKNLDDREILREFARLLRRPSLNLHATDDRNFKQLKSEEHPFVAFLKRFPDISHKPTGDDVPLSATDALDFLEILKGDLRRMDVDLDFDGVPGIAQPIQQALDYLRFYDQWSTNNPSPQHRCKGPLDNGGEAATFFAWVREVREVIRVYCPPQ